MASWCFNDLTLSGLKIINPFTSKDNRGSFLKSFEKNIFLRNGILFDPFESFESFSYNGVVRGMHFQTDIPQAKLVRVIHGEIYDVAVDLRKNSDTFGKWEGVFLSEENQKQLYIPEGFAHGFMVTSSTALVSYLCHGMYSPETDTGILWNDSTLAIEWPLNLISTPIVSARDSDLQSFNHFVDNVQGL